MQVGRETEVDCALAELYVRSMATERLVKDTAHSEIFNSIFTRMNEVGRCTDQKRLFLPDPQGSEQCPYNTTILLTYSMIQQTLQMGLGRPRKLRRENFQEV